MFEVDTEALYYSIAVFLATLLIAFIIAVIIIIQWFKKHKTSPENDINFDPAEVVTITASIKSKRTLNEADSSQDESPELQYEVTFSLEDSSELSLNVTEECYKRMTLQQNGTLVLSLTGDEFVDFQV